MQSLFCIEQNVVATLYVHQTDESKTNKRGADVQNMKSVVLQMYDEF